MKNNKQVMKQLENKTYLIWKMAFASALSWEIAKLAGSNHPYLAPISVILCMQSTVNQSIQFSYHRMVGTIIGIGITVLLSPYLQVNGWTLGLLILIGCFIAKWMKRDETVIHQLALTVLLVFVMEHKSHDYPIDRFRDTLIGAIVAVLIHMLVNPPNYTKQAIKGIHHFSDHLTMKMNRVANWIEQGLDHKESYVLQVEVKQLLQELHQMKNVVQDAEESLTYNPFANKTKKELQGYKEKITLLTNGYTYITIVIRLFLEWAEAGTISSSHKLVWAEQLLSLTPIFIVTDSLKPLGEKIEVKISPDFEPHRYHITLYTETLSLLNQTNVILESKN
ncbi:FUSC family protein [Bacillus sp. 1P10SD]|uniref:FUSC family protein n=1 Tax=Bacillus sp. 1P10SD TaxID=3132265 RepID=UPI0039A496F3